MTYGDMLAATRPWKGPFRVVTSNNETFDVWQREGFILTTGHIDIGLLKSGTDEYERTTWVDLGQIDRIEPLSQPVPVKDNGQKEG